MENVFENVSVLGTRVDLISLDELIEYILHTVDAREKATVANVNVHAINLAFELDWFRCFLNGSEVVYCDGFGIKWAADFLSGKKLHRLTPPDWFDRLAVECAKQGISIYFLGTRPDIIGKAAEVTRRRLPNLHIVGFHHGYFDKSMESHENRSVVGHINSLRPGILLVGFGMPTQEKWILENRGELDCNVILPVGAFFDYIAGETARAPRWMTDHGLEWVGRLLIEPKRLWRRYILGNPAFLWRILRQKILNVGS